MRKILLLIIGIVLIQISAYAGNTISGRITDDEKGIPLIGATATIFDSKGNIITGTTADVNGNFTLKNINNGSYTMSFQYLGYNEERIEITNLDRDLDMGDIRLTITTVSLEEVIVSGDAVVKR